MRFLPRASFARPLAAVWALLTNVLLLLPGSSWEAVAPGLGLDEALEVTAHFVLYFVLTCLVWAGFVTPTDDTPGPSGREWLVALAVLCVGLEVLQIQVPNRSVELVDIAVGLLGIGVASVWARRVGSADLYSRSGR